METLRIALFGGLHLSTGGERFPPFPTQAAASLFAFLVLNRGRLYPRAVLVGKFCGERPESSARKWLRTELWRVRHTLQEGQAGAEGCVIARGRDIGFDDRWDYWLDVEEFESSIREAGSRPGSEADFVHLRRAIDLYAGDLLEGCYDEWSLVEQERLRALYLRALEVALHYHADRGETQQAIAYGRRLLARDPMREAIHRVLMQCHYGAGDRAAAVRQYRLCRKVLRKELAVAPMRETVELYEQILRQAPAAPGPAYTIEADAARGGTVSELTQVAAQLDHARRRLHATIRALDVPDSPGASAGGRR